MKQNLIKKMCLELFFFLALEWGKKFALLINIINEYTNTMSNNIQWVKIKLELAQLEKL